MRGVNLHLSGGLSYAQYVEQIRQVVHEYARLGPVYLWGHSMGADLAADAASSSEVKAVVAAGFPVTSSPPNLLLILGCWDQLHSLPEMPGPVEILPAADHNMENFDPRSSLVAARHFGMPGRPQWADPFLARGWLAMGLILVCLARPPAAWGALAIFVAVWRWDPFHTVPAAIMAGFAASRGEPWRLSWRQVGWLGAAALSAHLVVAYPTWSTHPAWLLQLPWALAIGIPCSFMKAASGLPWWIYLGLWGAEVRSPGLLTRALCWLPQTSWRQLASLQWQGLGGVTPGQMGLFILLLLGAGGAWWQVFAAGYWPDPEQWRRLAYKLGGLLLTPLIVWIVGARRAAPSRQEPNSDGAPGDQRG